MIERYGLTIFLQDDFTYITGFVHKGFFVFKGCQYWECLELSSGCIMESFKAKTRKEVFQNICTKTRLDGPYRAKVLQDPTKLEGHDKEIIKTIKLIGKIKRIKWSRMGIAQQNKFAKNLDNFAAPFLEHVKNQFDFQHDLLPDKITEKMCKKIINKIKEESINAK